MKGSPVRKYLIALLFSISWGLPVAVLLLALTLGRDVGLIGMIFVGGPAAAITLFLHTGMSKWAEWYWSSEGEIYRALTLFVPLLLILTFAAISAASDKERGTNLVITIAVIVALCGMVAHQVIQSYRNGKELVDESADRKVQEIHQMYRDRKIVSTSLIAICRSCAELNVLNLGQGQKCNACQAWVPREWGV